MIDCRDCRSGSGGFSRCFRCYPGLHPQQASCLLQIHYLGSVLTSSHVLQMSNFSQIHLGYWSKCSPVGSSPGLNVHLGISGHFLHIFYCRRGQLTASLLLYPISTWWKCTPPEKPHHSALSHHPPRITSSASWTVKLRQSQAPAAAPEGWAEMGLQSTAEGAHKHAQSHTNQG